MKIQSDIIPTLEEHYEHVTMENVYIGARVVRGDDWDWWDQDGGGEGQIVFYDSGWATVEWDNGNENGYRIGCDNAHDLKFIP